MNCKDSQTEFLADMLKCQRIGVIIGAKNGGKTFYALNVIKFCILTNVYKRFYIVMPNFKSDQNLGMYDFMKFLKKDIKIKIYSEYSPLVIASIMEEQKIQHAQDKKEGKNLTPAFFMIDDATSASADICTDQLFLKCMTESRHLRLFMFIVVHSIKKILSPVIRANADFVALFKITNSKLLEAFYDEFISMFPDFTSYREFKKYYFSNVLSVKYNGLFINMIENKYCANIKDWWINNYDFDKHFLSNNKAKQIEEKKVKIIEPQ